MPIKWSGLQVLDAMDVVEKFINQTIEPLRQALAATEESATIPNLPDYMKYRILRLSNELKRITGGIIYGHQFQSQLISSIETIRDSIPKEALKAEKAREKAGKQDTLI